MGFTGIMMFPSGLLKIWRYKSILKFVLKRLYVKFVEYTSNMVNGHSLF